MSHHNKETAKLVHDYDVTERLDLAAEEFEIKIPPEYAHADLMMEARENILHLRMEVLKGLKELQLEQKKNAKK